jgi:hypothetical protein
LSSVLSIINPNCCPRDTNNEIKKGRRKGKNSCTARRLRNTVGNQHVLQHKFFFFMAHITEVKTMASMFSDVEASVSDIPIMKKILCKLPPNYRSFTTSIRQRASC